jgi:hypothetical protein
MKKIENLKPVQVVDEEGNVETVYVQYSADDKKSAFKENITIAYFVLGTIVLSMTAWITFKHLNKK